MWHFLRSKTIFGLLLLVCFQVVRSSSFKKRQYRIIDAETVEKGRDNFPFIVAFFFLSEEKVCTAVSITKRLALSAAHCLRHALLLTKQNCTLDSRIKSCKTLRNGDMRLRLRDNEAWLVVGVNDLSAATEQHRRYIKYVYRHRDSYLGGEYGSRGGYDITLVKTFSHVDLAGFPLVALPSPDFLEEGKAQVLGFGTAKRAPCEVNQLGPEKSRFCGMAEDCDLGTESCPVHFSYNGMDRSKCLFLQTPISGSCSRFWQLKPDESSPEIALLSDGEAGLRLAEWCYRPTPGAYGWCGTATDIGSTGKAGQRFDIRPDRGWGFCTRICSSVAEEDDPDSIGKLRKKFIDVLDKDYCEAKMLRRLRDDFRRADFEIRPKILCVGLNHTFKTVFYNVNDTDATLISLSEKSILEITNRSRSWYVSAPGICFGDSGGPLMKKNGKIYVLIGIVSKGTQETFCGGPEALTHYVRVSEFVTWIERYAKGVNVLSTVES